jgi:hypothetical protein
MKAAGDGETAGARDAQALGADGDAWTGADRSTTAEDSHFCITG